MPDSKTHRHDHRGRTNPPQHLFDNGTGIAEGVPSGKTGRADVEKPTGPNTAPPGMPDVSDPHPPDEGHPYAAPSPGGDSMPPSDTEVPHVDIGPNPARHD